MGDAGSGLLAGVLAGSSARRQAARVRSLDENYLAPLISQMSTLGTRRRKTQLLSGSPHSGSKDNHVKGRMGSTEWGAGQACRDPAETRFLMVHDQLPPWDGGEV